VVTTTKTERELELEERLAAVEAAKRKREEDVAHLQDENALLKTIPAPPAKTPPVSKAQAWGYFVSN
jgi:hypothetical protein